MDQQRQIVQTHLAAAIQGPPKCYWASSHGPLDHFPGATKMIGVGV